MNPINALNTALSDALHRALNDPLALTATEDVDRLDLLAQQCAGDAAAGFALALAVIRLHDARDSYRLLDQLNARLLAWFEAQSKPIAIPAPRASPETAWDLVLAEGLVLAALHSQALPCLRDTLCKSLIERLAGASSPDAELQRLRMRGLTTALAYSQLAGNLAVRLELDAIAAQGIRALPDSPFEVGRWWVERTMIEIQTYLLERRAEPPIKDLLASTESELAKQPDAITHFRHARNRFEWARVEKDVPRARLALDALRQARVAMPLRSRVWNIVLLRAKAMLAIDTLDHVDAERFAREAILVADEISAAANLRMALWTTLVNALAVQERAADAAIAAEKASTYALTQHRDILTALAHLLHARAEWSSHYLNGKTHLQSAMQMARAANYSQFLVVNPTMVAWLAARALDHDIEPAFVTEVVTRRSLPPPPDAGAQWPWAVRIRLLGGCAVEGESVNLAGAGKAQHKPLDIIQLLAIAGPKGLDRANLARAIYGSAMLDSPATLNMAISRARRLLGDDSLIDAQSGRIYLDAERVYVDLWAMQALKPASDEEAAWHCTQLLTLYAGPLLQGSSNADKHRIVAATYRDRFVALIVSLSAKVPADQAIDALHQAINREPMSEPLYRALIERLAQRGDAAEAVDIYQQCEHALSQAYGVAPSERTQRLIDAVRKASPPRAARAAVSAKSRKKS